MSSPKKVLHVVSAMNRGGAETMIMNLYRCLNTEEVQFEFISHNKVKDDFDDEIQKMGGKIFRIKSLGESGFINYIKSVCKIIEDQGPFDVIHAHTDIQAGIVNLAAMLSKVKVRVCHAHTTKWRTNPSMKDNIQSYILRKLSCWTSNVYIACSNEAGRFFFGERNLKNNKVNIINNGIDIEKFICCDAKPINFEYDNELILGHIGRFSEEKNHKFLIELAKELVAKKINFKMFLIGDGIQRKHIEETILRESLQDKVLCLGKRTDIANILKNLDYLLLPSFYEGIPVCLIEAQAAGTKCLVSNGVSKSSDMGLNLIEFIDLKNMELWIEKISNINKVKLEDSIIEKKLTENGYSAKKNISNLLSIYDFKELLEE